MESNKNASDTLFIIHRREPKKEPKNKINKKKIVYVSTKELSN